jgi:hypothetical protein
VFVVVQKDDSSEDDVTRYRVAVTASQPVRTQIRFSFGAWCSPASHHPRTYRQVPLFGPRLPTDTPVFEKGRDFTEFLYTKRAPPPPLKAPLPWDLRAPHLIFVEQW